VIVYVVLSVFIASQRNRNLLVFFALGLVCGPLGPVAAAVAPQGNRPPKGMREVFCLRCGKGQYVGAQESRFECWQCQARLVL